MRVFRILGKGLFSAAREQAAENRSILFSAASLAAKNKSMLFSEA
jgi:hypothetical protein